MYGLAARALALLALGCGSSSSRLPSSPGPPGATATVRFAYVAETTTDPQVAASFPQCVRAVIATHIHASWRSYGLVLLQPAADRWQTTFDDVPVGSEQRIRINDPNACDTDTNGAVTDNVFANGVRLSRLVDTPGNGIEPGFAFVVSADGSVSP